MSNKCVIRNCPVCEFSDWEECTGYLAEGYICNDIHTEIIECQDRTDCVMKQIIQVCNEYSDKWEDCDFSNGLSDEIFKLLDIEECE